METESPTVAVIIDEFFEDVLSDQKRVARGRTIRVRNSLTAFVADRGAGLLGPEELTLLRLERQFTPDAGVADVTTAGHLLRLLPGFVAIPQLLPVRLDARAQVWLVRELLLSMGGLYDRRAFADIVHEVYRQLGAAEVRLHSWLVAERHPAAIRAAVAGSKLRWQFDGSGTDPPAPA
jgi:hypothetical protein